jgi:UDP-N-acetylglucosamine 2-epimerase (non-hydrolysing)
MRKLKVMVFIGTRPEAIKMVSVIKVLKQYNTQVSLTLVTTTQHRDMFNSVLRLFQISIFSFDIL